MAKFLIGLTAGVGIAYLAFRAKALNSSGAFAAAILGTIIFGLGGVGWAVLLLTFFISSSALSKIINPQKSDIGQNFAKGSRRDAGQVMANGGTAGALVFIFFILQQAQPQHPCLPILWVAFGASLAAANADTWATELGIFNPGQPVLLTTLKRVPRGTSGAVSLVGSLAALAGAGLVGGMAVLSHLAGWAPEGGPVLFSQWLLITIGGFLGAMVDSFFGATIQSVYHCPTCHKETERHPLHHCGTKTSLKRGIPWLNNDWVNTACTLTAALTTLIILFLKS
jgi:uncharacterized protein (TIGR00297 family)